MRRRSDGFTLVELLTVLAIIAILVAIAYPSYQQYVMRANRSEAKNLLLRIAAEQEKFFTTFNRYSANIGGPRTGDPATSGLNMDDSTESVDPGDTAFYTVAVDLAGNGLSYTLRATPSGSFQSTDPCGPLTLTNAGVRDAEGGAAPDNCW
jgi:type IV pilus assembly protein PilE